MKKNLYRSSRWQRHRWWWWQTRYFSTWKTSLLSAVIPLGILGSLLCSSRNVVIVIIFAFMETLSGIVSRNCIEYAEEKIKFFSTWVTSLKTRSLSTLTVEKFPHKPNDVMIWLHRPELGKWRSELSQANGKMMMAEISFHREGKQSFYFYSMPERGLRFLVFMTLLWWCQTEISLSSVTRLQMTFSSTENWA